MRIPLSVRLKAIFARDKNEFWWNHFTDEERELREVNVSQLASVINEATVRHNTERRIDAKYMLSARLAQIQSRASWGSGVLGFTGAIIRAALTDAMTFSMAQAAA